MMDPRNRYLSNGESIMLSMSDFGKNDKKTSHKHATKGKKLSTTTLLAACVLGFMFMTMFINIYWLRQMQSEHMKVHPSAIMDEDERKPVLWVYAKNTGTGYLQHVFYVFHRIGFRLGTEESNWDVLWSHDYPFVKLQSTMQELKASQKVNKFPGSGFITNKVSLATSDIHFIPKAFRIPAQKSEFLRYARANPLFMWVQKSNNHRGIKILPLKQLDLSTDNTFIQQYIHDPYLIDGKRFDIGIYVALTSIDPLRVYMFEGDWLLRFCMEDYYPFDPKKLEKYVVGDDYIPTWKMPSLKEMYNEKSFTHKQSFFHYLKKDGKDTSKLEHDIQAAIREVYIDKEHHLISAAERYPSKRNFFELVRFDFVVDKYLNIYLMEVNMSPNLSSRHFAQNKLLYEQVLFGLFSIAGVAKSVTSHIQQLVHIGKDSNLDEMNMQVSDRDIQLDLDICASGECDHNCISDQCKLCKSCWNMEERACFKSAFLEHLNKKTYKRVFPPRFSDKKDAEIWQDLHEKDMEKYNEKNNLMFLWFKEKCLKDITWCT